jgi:hypothetical protein
MATVDFDDHDAWIFWAIPVSEEGTDLRGIIGAADAINHAIPSREQIESSINRGLRAGLLERCGERLRFAPTHRKEVGEACSVSRAWARQWDAILAYLASKDWHVVDDVGYQLSEHEYNGVVEEYLRTFQ